jgi:hypothetical protein
MQSNKGPFPGAAFEALMDANVMSPMVGIYSGEIIRNIGETPIGAVRKGGVVVDVWMSVGASGNTATQVPLMISGEVLINGATCLSTVPVISHVSGESSQQKTTKVTGDTGITQAVVDTTANTVTDGDIITFKATLDRTASPTTEISNLCIVVELGPPEKS